ncbi:MAG: hypothetical protein Q4E43_01790 [Akkermansia sp.]|nr:hypothetical protein [Akkermansia sp.]
MKTSFLTVPYLLYALMLPLGAHEHDGHEHCEHEHDHEHEHCDHEHEHEHCDHDHEHESVVVKADEHSRHILAIQTESVPAAGQRLVYSVYGTLTVPQHALRTYALPSAGRVTLHVKSAQAVRKGDLLYTLESPQVADAVAERDRADAAAERCSAEIAAMEQRVKRLNDVGTRNSDLEEQLLFKRAELRQLTQDAASASARLSMLCLGAELAQENGALSVRAAADGIVRNVGFTQGGWGEQGTAVVTMADTAALEVAAPLHAASVPEIGTVRSPLSDEGTWRLDEQVDPATQTRTLYFTPAHLPQGARAGQLCRLDIFNGTLDDDDIVTIPDSAIVKVGADDLVFVEVAEGTYAAVKVHAGESRFGMTPVEGLAPGQRMVVKGGHELRNLLPADGAAKKAGHFHADGHFHEGED